MTDKKTLAKLFPIIDEAIENAIGIESFKNRYYYDERTIYFHTLLSGYIDGDYFVPIRFGIKENNQSENKLYVMVGQNKIDLRVLKLPAQINERNNSRLKSTISIPEIFKNVNSKDLLRYIPDDMINAEQRKIKYEGIAETIKYTNDITEIENITNGNLGQSIIEYAAQSISDVSDTIVNQKNSGVNRKYAQNTNNNTNSVDYGRNSFGDEDEQYLQAVTNLAA